VKTSKELGNEETIDDENYDELDQTTIVTESVDIDYVEDKIEKI